MLKERAPKGTVVRHVRELGMALNTPDAEWARYCKKHGLVFVTEDRRIRTRPQEVQAFKKARIGYVEVRIKVPAGPEKLAVYSMHADALLGLAKEPVPFCMVMARSGIRRVVIDQKVRKSL